MSDLLRLNDQYFVPWNMIDYNTLINHYKNKNLSKLWASTPLQEFEIYASKTINGYRKDMDNSEIVEVNDMVLGGIERENRTIDDFGDYNTYFCHVCNTSVPSIYAKDHNKSTKHRTCLKIIDTALERARHQMLLHHEDTNITNNNNSYYCDSCSIVVRIKDKNAHEETKEHREAVKHDKLLHELFMVYIDNVEHIDNTDKIIDSKVRLVNYVNDLKAMFNKPVDFVTIINEHVLEVKAIDGSKAKISVNNFNGYYDLKFCKICSVFGGIMDEGMHDHSLTEEHMRKTATNVNVNFIRQDIIFGTGSHCILCNEVFLNEDQHIKTMEHKMKLHTIERSNQLELMQYVQESKRKCKTNPIHDMKFINEDMIEMIAVDGSKVRVTAKQFHGLDDGGTRCKLCDESLLNVNQHCWTEKHMDFVMTPLLDRNFLRDFNFRGHCLLCNTVFNSPSVHTCSDAHKQKLKNVTICEKHMNNNYNVANIPTYSSVAKISIINQSDSKPVNSAAKIPINNQSDSKPVNSAPKIPINNQSDSKPVNSAAKIPVNNAAKIIETSKLKEDGVTYCKPCNRFIDTHNYKAHVKGKIHMEKVSEKVAQNKNAVDTIDYRIFMTYVNGKDVGCKVCKRPVEHDQFKEHALTPSHVGKYLKLLSNNKMKHVDDGFFCSVCEIFIHKTKIITILNHIEAKSHIENLKVAMDNETEIVTQSKDNYCKVCDCRVPLGGMQIHENGGPHKAKLQLLAHKPESPKPNGNPTQPPKPTEHIIHPHVEATSIPKVSLCKVCMVDVPSVNISEHIRGFNHTINYNVLKTRNMLKELDEKLFCECCNVDVELDTGVDHVATDVHKDNLLKANESEELHHMMEISNNSNIVKCKVCDMHVLNGPIFIEAHIATKGHIEKYNDFLIRNHIKKMNSEILFCDLCLVKCKHEELFEHIKTEMHESKSFKHPHMEETDNIKVLNCNICKTAIPNIKDSILEHVNGHTHKSKCASSSQM